MTVLVTLSRPELSVLLPQLCEALLVSLVFGPQLVQLLQFLLLRHKAIKVGINLGRRGSALLGMRSCKPHSVTGEAEQQMSAALTLHPQPAYRSSECTRERNAFPRHLAWQRGDLACA